MNDALKQQGALDRSQLLAIGDDHTMGSVLEIVRQAMGQNHKIGRMHMNKSAKQYVTVKAVVAANARLVENAGSSQVSKLSPLGKPLPPPPSREAMAQAGARALQFIKAAA